MDAMNSTAAITTRTVPTANLSVPAAVAANVGLS